MAEEIAQQASMEEIVALCKRRGFVFPSSEIYGGLGSTYDYGHYGVLLKNNVKEQWWRAMLQEREDIVALDSAILQHPRVWEASGHLAGFTDPLVDCRTCKLRFRADRLEDGRCAQKPSKAPGEGPNCDLTEAAPSTSCSDLRRRRRRRMLKDLSPPGDRAGHFRAIQERPRGRAQETPLRHRADRQGLPQRDQPAQLHLPLARVRADGARVFRSTRPGPRATESWIEERLRFYMNIGLRARFPQVHAHQPEELALYSSGTNDIEFVFPFGWSELEGIAKRGDFDLTQHTRYSGEKLEYFDQETKERFVPHVVEPAAGADRTTLAFLVDSYEVEEVEGAAHGPSPPSPPGTDQGRDLAAALKEGMPEKAREIFASCAGEISGRLRRGRLNRQALPAPG